MSSPKLNVLISVGGLCLNIVCLMFGMDFFLAERYPEATVTCQVRQLFQPTIELATLIIICWISNMQETS